MVRVADGVEDANKNGKTDLGLPYSTTFIAFTAAAKNETSVFDGSHVNRISGIPVTSVARTLCDLTAVVRRSWVIERGLVHELGGKVSLDYLPGGVACTIDIPSPAGAGA